jgi:hypothetical protein
MFMAMVGGGSRATTGMVERGDVLGALERLLQDARDGRGGALFVVGPAGLGKTTVLEAAITTAGTGFAVSVGRGDQVESVLPFGLIGQALDQILGGRLLGGSVAQIENNSATADTVPEARFYGILRGIREAAVGPLLLALDDLHWSDLDSLTAIHLICRRPPCQWRSSPLAGRAEGALTSAQDLAAQGLVEIQPLAPLSADAARTLLRSRVSERVRGYCTSAAPGSACGLVPRPRRC